MEEPDRFQQPTTHLHVLQPCVQQKVSSLSLWRRKENAPQDRCLTFITRDVLRRHERTCKSRERLHDTSFEVELHERDTKRQRCSQGSEFISDALGHAQTSTVDSASQMHGLRDYDYRLFEDMIGLSGSPSANVSSPLDFSALDFLLFPRIASDTFPAEKLEYMAYFTSARGLSTFTDRPSFLRRQKLVAEAYDSKLLHDEGNTPLGRSILDRDTSGVPTNPESDELALKSLEIVENFRSISSDRHKENSVSMEWSTSVSERCSTFFSPGNIRRFLEYFWSLWYPHCPIVHKPLFHAPSASSPLLCVMIIIGACLSPQEHDAESAREWMDSAEELTFSHECFKDETTAGQATNISMKEKLQYLQASYLVCSLQKREGSVEAQARSRRHRHASMVAVRY